MLISLFNDSGDLKASSMNCFVSGSCDKSQPFTHYPTGFVGAFNSIDFLFSDNRRHICVLHMRVNNIVLSKNSPGHESASD